MKTAILLFALLGSVNAATVLRIACGGAGGTDAQGNVWAADASFTGGASWTATNQAAMAAQAIPYRSLRYATSFSYTLPLPAGAYNVTLKFVEPNKTGGGQRLLNVSVNSSQAIAGLDLYSVAGLLHPYDRTFAASSNGQLRIDLTATAGNAVLSAIQVDDVPVVKPIVVWEGDSLTAYATNPGNMYPEVVAVALSNIDSHNSALSGSILPDVTGYNSVARRAPSVDSTFAASNQATKIESVFIGHNDVAYGFTPAQFLANLKAYCLQRKTANPGLRILIVPILPSNQGGSVAFNAARNAYNAAVVADPSFYDSYLSAALSNPHIGVDGAENDTTYFFDGTHLTTLGQSILAGYVEAALPALYVPVVVVPADDGVKITCKSDTLTVGQQITADSDTQEITILTDIPGNWRWDQITICPTERFLGQTMVTASMGRAGTNNDEMAVQIPMQDSSGNSNCWTAHPGIPQLIGPYEVVIALRAFIDDGTGKLVPGNLSKLTGGTLTWESCGYPGKIGTIAKTAVNLDKVPLLQCSGSDSHTDPKTGQTVNSDCAGLLWASFPGGPSLIGVNMPVPASTSAHWARVR